MLAGGRPDRLLDDDADAPRDEWCDPHDRLAAETRDPRTGLDDRGIDDVRGHLHAGHQVARLHGLTIEDREQLQRIEAVQPLELGNLDVDHPGNRRDEVEAALVRSAHVQVGAGHRLREADRGVILVELARLRDDDGHRRSGVGRGEGKQVLSGESSALAPAPPGDGQVAGEDAACQAPGNASTRRDPLDAHARNAVLQPGSAAERGLDRATGEHHRHARSIVAIGVDVTVDMLAVGRVLRGGSDGFRRTVAPDECGLHGLGSVGDLAHAGQRDAGMADAPAR